MTNGALFFGLNVDILLLTYFSPLKTNEAVESDAANTMMDRIRDEFVNGDLSTLSEDPSGIKLVMAEEFG